MENINLQHEAFTSKQVCELVGITLRQIIHWDTQGVVKPSVRPASGKGTQRLYSYADLIALKAVKVLRDRGISLQKIRKCIRFLRNHLPDVSQPLSYCTLVSTGDKLYMIKDRQTLMDTIENPGQLASEVLLVGELDRELRRKVVRLARKRVHEVIVGDCAYQVEIEADPESGGYVAEVAGLPGCITQGDSLEETLEMAKDAVGTYLEAAEDLKKRGVTLPIARKQLKRRSQA